MRRCRALARALTAAAVLAVAPTAAALGAAGADAAAGTEVAVSPSSISANNTGVAATTTDRADAVTSSPSAAAPPARSNDSGVAGTAVFVVALLAVGVIGTIVAVELRGGRSS